MKHLPTKPSKYISHLLLKFESEIFLKLFHKFLHSCFTTISLNCLNGKRVCCNSSGSSTYLCRKLKIKIQKSAERNQSARRSCVCRPVDPRTDLCDKSCSAVSRVIVDQVVTRLTRGRRGIGKGVSTSEFSRWQGKL